MKITRNLGERHSLLHLAVSSIEHETAGKRIKKGPARHPIPVMIPARLAVDLKFQGQSIGSEPLKDAVPRILEAADLAGIRWKI